MSPIQRTRLLIADDHNLVAEVCKSLLEPEFEVVGIVNDGRALLSAAGQLKPDIVIIDISMPLLNGLDAGEQLRDIVPAARLVYLSVNTDPEVAAEAFRRGASAYVPKNAAAKELVTAIREVRRGVSYLIPADHEGYCPVSAQKRQHARSREAAYCTSAGNPATAG